MPSNRLPRTRSNRRPRKSKDVAWIEHAELSSHRAAKTTTESVLRETRAQAKSGRRSDGRAFPAYTSNYARRKRGGGPLSVSGRFLAAIYRQTLTTRRGVVRMIFTVRRPFEQQALGLDSAGYRWAGLSKPHRGKVRRALERARLWVTRRGPPSRSRRR